jgi:hypothetical protein
MRKNKAYCFPARNLLEKLGIDQDASLLAEIVGVERHTIVRWRNAGSNFTWFQADEIAVRLGYHPMEIWPNWIDESLKAAS